MSKSDEVYKYIDSKLEYLKNNRDTGKGRRIMANLRRGVGKQPGELPELWGIIFEGISDNMLQKNQVSYEEWSIYTALTLYALHQQGCENNMNQKKISIGHAVARLIKNDDDESRILKRLHLVVTAVSLEDMAYHLRGIIQLLKQAEIPLDYAKFAKELYWFHDEEIAQNIKLQWGRDFWMERNKANKKD